MHLSTTKEEMWVMDRGYGRGSNCFSPSHAATEFLVLVVDIFQSPAAAL